MRGGIIQGLTDAGEPVALSASPAGELRIEPGDDPTERDLLLLILQEMVRVRVLLESIDN